MLRPCGSKLAALKQEVDIIAMLSPDAVTVLVLDQVKESIVSNIRKEEIV